MRQSLRRITLIRADRHPTCELHIRISRIHNIRLIGHRQGGEPFISTELVAPAT